MPIRVDDADLEKGNGKGEMRGSFASLQDDDFKNMVAVTMQVWLLGGDR
jgi:hypothetical protein